MLSRAASSIYWMSRYLERADNVARFIAVNAHLILDMRWERKMAQWEPLVSASGDNADFNRRYDAPNEKNVVRFLTFDAKNPNSILSCVQRARENARTVREVISSEMWETLNALYHLTVKHSRKRSMDDLQDFFVEVRTANHLFIGRMENTMSHTEGWHFARMGRLLERADKTARVLDVKYFLLSPVANYLESPYDEVEWGAVLKSVSGFEMYRQQFHRINYHDVTQFLIFDAHFPRAIRHCIYAVGFSLRHVAHLLGVTVSAQEEIAALKALIEGTTIEAVLQGGLHEFIDGFQRSLNQVDDSLYQAFFALKDGVSTR